MEHGAAEQKVACFCVCGVVFVCSAERTSDGKQKREREQKICVQKKNGKIKLYICQHGMEKRKKRGRTTDGAVRAYVGEREEKNNTQTNRIGLECVFSFVPSHETCLVQRLANDNVLDCVEHSADVVRVRCACDVRVHLLVGVAVFAFELLL